MVLLIHADMEVGLRLCLTAHDTQYLKPDTLLGQDYPAQPFFLRVVAPRCVWYTGHVTAGGSICIEALTLSGGTNGWTSALCVESVLTLVITNMCAPVPRFCLFCSSMKPLVKL